MNNTIEDFKAQVKDAKEVIDIDNICFSWLKLLCMDYGRDGERASTLLDIVNDILTS